MSLRTKLFYSHLLVMFISIITVALIAGLLSTFTFEEIINDENSINQIDGFIYPFYEEDIVTVDTALNISLIVGLGLASILSIGIAFLISLFLSKRMVLPIYDVIKASQRIADGHYNQRVSYHSQDEIGKLVGYFNHMADSLDNVEGTRRQLLADLTHELNTPLSGIISTIEGLQDGMLLTETSHIVIHDEALRLQRLVRDVQYLSSVEANVYSLHRESLSVDKILHAVADKLRIQYENKSVQLIIDAPPYSLTVDADYDRITQVFINLLGNALQYTSAGGQVKTSIRVLEDKLEFIIADTGIGIAPFDLKHIFNRFYRVEKSRDRRSGGSGIGLTIAKTLVEAHQGCIWATSEGVGQGSQFHFTLPIASTL